MDFSGVLKNLAEDFAEVVPAVDENAEHSRWENGIGPFEEERQVEMIQQAAKGISDYTVRTEQPYPNRRERCDLLVESDSDQIPIEAKLIRFRYDNGNIDPNSFARVFSPFPERTSSSLLTDAQKLYRSDFPHNGALLGIYYEAEDEQYKQMTADGIAEKFCFDVEYWLDLEVKTRSISQFTGLRHPYHQQGAIIQWEIVE